MNFTSKELRLIDEANSRIQLWKRFRWFALAGGAAMASFSLYKDGLDSVLKNCNLSFPLMGVLAFLWAVSRWNGDPREKLLVKLAEQQGLAVESACSTQQGKSPTL